MDSDLRRNDSILLRIANVENFSVHVNVRLITLQRLGTWYLVLGTWYLVLGSIFHFSISRFQLNAAHLFEKTLLLLQASLYWVELQNKATHV